MKRYLLFIALLGCGRVHTVFRGATSVFRGSEPAPVHDSAERRDDVRLSVQWVGHATTLIQMDDRMILTDPAITPTVGLLSKRLVDPGVDPIPAVDLAVISHMHFDHLSYASLELLQERITLLAIPDGGFPYLPNFAFEARSSVAWSTFEHAEMRITAVPAAHGGWRYGVDAAWANAACGWVVEYHGLSVYFAGDTGYDEAMFRAIGKRFPSLDVAILPIAPMEPHKLMGQWHMNPAEALHGLSAVGAKLMIPTHYDTFINSLDSVGTAIPTLIDAAGSAQAAKLRVLRIGERIVLIPR